jgi:hypothetical protein
MGPVITLLLLAPVIAEVLFGVTRITTLFVLIPQIGAWGCGALIIRYLVRRRRQGWTAILLLGTALAVAEECLIQQTSLAPLVGVDPEHVYGRAVGVNWVYLLWALGYESIWAVVLPIQLTELIFPGRRDDPWVGKRGLVIATVAFVLASFVAWYSWTQVAVPMYFHGPVYWPPVASLLMAVAAIALLMLAALRARAPSGHGGPAARSAPHPWLAGVTAFMLGLPWSALVLIGYGAVPALPVAVPIVSGLALACAAFLLIRHWSSSAAWQDVHRLALVFGALVGNMLAGFAVMRAGGVLPVDLVGKIVLNVIAVLLMVRLASRIRQRQENR